MKKTSMDVAILSTYSPLKCGIAYYTRDLINALFKKTDLNMFVFSSSNNNSAKVFNVWERDKILSVFKIIKSMKKIKSDIIHIQFHPALYGSSVFSSLFVIALLIYFKLARCNIIITLHTIPEIKGIKNRIMFKYAIRLLTLFPRKIVVHTNEQNLLLKDSYNIKAEKIFVIPIGVNKINSIEEDRLESFKRKNQLENKFVVLSCPHLRFGLEVEYVIEALARCKDNNILFVINGLSPATHDTETRYLNQLMDLRERLRLREKVRFITDREEWEETRLFWCNAANLIVYSHSNYPSQDSSMSLGDGLGLYKPLIVFDVPKFREVARILQKNGLDELVVPDIEPEAKIVYMCRAIEMVRGDYHAYSDKTKRILKGFTEGRTWDKIASLTYHLYKEVLNERRF